MTSEPHLQNQAPQYSVASLVLATAIGTLFAAAALLSLNCRRLNWPRQAAVVVAVLVLAGCVELWAIWSSPGDLISQLLSHTLFAVVAAYLLLRALRKRDPFVCNTLTHGAAPSWHAVAAGITANLAVSGALAKAAGIASVLQ